MKHRTLLVNATFLPPPPFFFFKHHASVSNCRTLPSPLFFFCISRFDLRAASPFLSFLFPRKSADTPPPLFPFQSCKPNDPAPPSWSLAGLFLLFFFFLSRPFLTSPFSFFQATQKKTVSLCVIRGPSSLPFFFPPRPATRKSSCPPSLSQNGRTSDDSLLLIEYTFFSLF